MNIPCTQHNIRFRSKYEITNSVLLVYPHLASYSTFSCSKLFKIFNELNPSIQFSRKFCFFKSFFWFVTFLINIFQNFSKTRNCLKLAKIGKLLVNWIFFLQIGLAQQGFKNQTNFLSHFGSC